MSAPYTATGKVVKIDGHVAVEVHWSGGDSPIDRPHTTSIGCPPDLAGRLVAAINAQKAFTHPRLKIDIGGQTYIEAQCHVMGRHLKSNLVKLGF